MRWKYDQCEHGYKEDKQVVVVVINRWIWRGARRGKNPPADHPFRYTELQPVGMGAFGLVCAARDQLTGAPVAVKKIMKPFSTPVLSKRTYRELKLLKHLRHENVRESLNPLIAQILTMARSFV